MSEKVIVARQGAVARLVLDRPEALNAIGPDMAAQLYRTARELSADPSVRCVVVAGAGPHFMAGGDIRYFVDLLPLPAAERDAKFSELITDVGNAVACLQAMPKPVIGAVRGAVAGFGFSLMCACDLVVASRATVCKLAYGGLGTSPDGGGSYSLPRLLGVRRALEVALLDERLDAARALELGLVTRMVGDEALDAVVAELAGRLAGRRPRPWAAPSG